jgi:phosphoribosylanthranilate isomerase
MDRITPIVKICGLKTTEAIDAAVEAGADWVGFVFFEPSPRNLGLAQARSLGRRVAARARKVALTVDADDRALAGIVEALEPDMLQLHGREDPRRVETIRGRFGLPVIKAVGVAQRADLSRMAAFAGVVDAILLDAKAAPEASRPGGNGLPFEWDILTNFRPEGLWLLSGGLTCENVTEAIVRSGAPAVDVSSGVESEPGVKDPDLIARFVAAAKAALGGVGR